MMLCCLHARHPADIRCTCFAGSLCKARVTVCRDLLLWVILSDSSPHTVAVRCEASQCSLYLTCNYMYSCFCYTSTQLHSSEGFMYFLREYQRYFQHEHRCMTSYQRKCYKLYGTITNVFHQWLEIRTTNPKNVFPFFFWILLMSKIFKVI